MEASAENRLELAQAKLTDAKALLAELYARGAITVAQRRVVGDLGADVVRLRRELATDLPSARSGVTSSLTARAEYAPVAPRELVTAG